MYAIRSYYGPHDLVQVRFSPRLQPLRKFIEHVSDFVYPAALFLCFRVNIAQSDPNAESANGEGQLRRWHAPAFEVTEKRLPGEERRVAAALFLGQNVDLGLELLVRRITSYNVCYTKLLRRPYPRPGRRPHLHPPPRPSRVLFPPNPSRDTGPL